MRVLTLSSFQANSVGWLHIGLLISRNEKKRQWTFII